MANEPEWTPPPYGVEPASDSVARKLYDATSRQTANVQPQPGYEPPAWDELSPTQKLRWALIAADFLDEMHL